LFLLTFGAEDGRAFSANKREIKGKSRKYMTRQLGDKLSCLRGREIFRPINKRLLPVLGDEEDYSQPPSKLHLINLFTLSL
jgi:hypothetical protein